MGMVRNCPEYSVRGRDGNLLTVDETVDLLTGGNLDVVVCPGAKDKTTRENCFIRRGINIYRECGRCTNARYN